MISLFKKIFKSNILLIIIAEKISTFFNINFEDEYKIVRLINKANNFRHRGPQR